MYIIHNGNILIFILYFNCKNLIILKGKLYSIYLCIKLEYSLQDITILS